MDKSYKIIYKMEQNGLIELPLEFELKYKALSERFIGEDDNIIRQLTNLQSVRYIVNQPNFIINEIIDNQFHSKAVACSTIRLDSIKTSPFPDAFVIYGILNMSSSTYIRGAYIKYDGLAHQKMRDAKIDWIIGE